MEAAPAAGHGARHRRPRPRRTTPGSRIAYLYVLPFFVVFAAFSVYPWLSTAWVSLHDTRLSTYHESNWVGLDNYRNLFTNDFFWNAFRNTLTIGIISTVPQLCLALGIAHLLNYRMKGRTFFRVAILMPYATSLAAATVIFLELFDPELGLVNWALDLAHLPAVDWQGSQVAGAGRGLDHRHLALDRLQRADLPRRHAGDRLLALRVGGDRRRRQVEAVPVRHHPRHPADDPVHHHRLDHRSGPAVR